MKKDRHHDAVANALEKAGWTVEEQVTLYIGERNVWVDLKAQHDVDTIAILIEIKGFENMPSPIDYLEKVVGQYVLYQSILEWNKINTPLYLAVPINAYEGILSEPVGQAVIQKTRMKLLVFDVMSEEIQTWIE